MPDSRIEQSYGNEFWIPIPEKKLSMLLTIDLHISVVYVRYINSIIWSSHADFDLRWVTSTVSKFKIKKGRTHQPRSKRTNFDCDSPSIQDEVRACSLEGDVPDLGVHTDHRADLTRLMDGFNRLT